MKRSSAYPAGVNKFLRWSPKNSEVSKGLASSMMPSTTIVPSTSSSSNTVNVPPPPLMRKSTYGFTMDSLPSDHYHLGDNLFASVSEYKGAVRIHLRMYNNNNEKGRFTPTKNGVVLTPFGWQCFAEKLRKFPLRDKHGVLVVENELFTTTVYDSSSEVFTYRLQRMFVNSYNILQFYPSAMTLNYGNMDLLRDLSIGISNCVIDKLYGFLLPRAILREMDSLPRPIHKTEGEIVKLRLSLVTILKDYVEKNINDLYSCSSCGHENSNSLTHSCLFTNKEDKAETYFSRAIANVDINFIAKQFIVLNSCYSIPSAFINGIEGEHLTESVKSVYLSDGTNMGNDINVCAICTESVRSKKSLDCGHYFCKQCIDTWLTKENTCPICRANITIDIDDD